MYKCAVMLVRHVKRWLLYVGAPVEEQVQLRKAVRTVLEHVFERQEEVPLVGMYRCVIKSRPHETSAVVVCC
jgi:hypothetical protein